MKKTCKICKLPKELDQFGVETKGRYGRKAICKSCMRTHSYDYKQPDMFNHKNGLHTTNCQFERTASDIASHAKHRAKLMNKLPDNIDFNATLYIYRLRLAFQKMFNTPLHVDHIIPLSNGGLHHEDNLQILTAYNNRMKFDYDDKIVGIRWSDVKKNKPMFDEFIDYVKNTLL